MRKRERLAGSKAYRLRFETEKPKPPSMLRHTESAADALSDVLADAVLPVDETEEEENVGVQAVRTGRQGAESSVRRMSKQRQKKQIQRQYAAAQSGRQAEGITVQGAGEAVFAPVQRTERKIEGFIRKNRGKLVILLLAVMMTYMLSSLSGCMPIAQSLLESLVIGTYPAEEDDLIAAERAYCEMEDALQDELDRYGEIHPGYDEVQVEQMEIWHDPYALCAIISAYLGGEEWTIDSAYPVMERYFKLQYVLTEKITTETRYRTEQRVGQQLVTDPKTGAQRWESYTYEVEVPYTYRICDVKLENKNLSHQPVYSMSREKMGLYALYMSTLGNMPDLFAGKPHASQLKDPLLYDVPEEYKQADPQFGKLIEEAEKYLGFPYVWGGSSPDTSFDCSGFVSYVFTNSGVYNTGRLGATGLYGICQKITADEARPGDLIFFEGTMGEDVGGITHVGLYVGDNMMIHCGNPITYADLTRSYWQQHFYGFGRIPYDP